MILVALDLKPMPTAADFEEQWRELLGDIDDSSSR